MSDPRSELPTADQLQLRSLAERYFFGVDHRRPQAVVSCFSDPCRFVINAGNVIELCCKEDIQRTFSRPPLFIASNHTVSHHTVWSDEAGVAGVVYATAHVVVDAEDDRKILVRGLRYDDRYAYDHGAWHIIEREHNPIWQFEAIATALNLHDRRTE